MAKSLAMLIDEEFGAETEPRINPLRSSIGTTALQLFAQNPNRVAFHLVNLSSNTMYVGPFADVSASKGYRVGPGGGTLISRYQIDWHLTGNEWYVVATASSSSLLSVEIVIV